MDSINILISGSFNDDDGCPTSIPFELKQYHGQAAFIVVYREANEIAREFSQKFDGDLFSQTAINFLRDSLTPVAESYGFYPDTECGFTRDYARIPGQNFGSGIAEPYKTARNNFTGFDLDYLTEMGLRCYVVTYDRIVVSAACEAPYPEGSDDIEIGVETAEGFRGRGFASACVGALAGDINARGKSAVYIAQEDNAPSHAVAKRAGFTERGRCYSSVFISK